MSRGKVDVSEASRGNVRNSHQYHPVAFAELQERFMAEIRINHKRLTALEQVIAPLMARTHCVCTDEEAQALNLKAIEAAEKACEEFGGIEKITECFQIWLDHQRETQQL
jgi:hypothetical protein